MIELATDEQVQLVKRKHWFIIFAELSAYGIIFLIPFFAYIFISGNEITLGNQIILLELETSLFIFIASAWTLLIWMRAVGVWTDYYLDVWMVTDKRIIDIEQKSFFHRQTSVFRIERIQDITIETRGIIATLLNFGDIHVQTAGESQEFVMLGIANPKYVRRIILRQQDRITNEETSMT